MLGARRGPGSYCLAGAVEKLKRSPKAQSLCGGGPTSTTCPHAVKRLELNEKLPRPFSAWLWSRGPEKPTPPLREWATAVLHLAFFSTVLVQP